MDYRYNTVMEYSASLKSLSEQFQTKIKKYKRRITVIDITVYSLSGVLASAGIILSSVTMIAPVAVPIAISTITTLAGITTAITKKISSCSQSKLRDYIYKYNLVVDASSKLSTLISKSIDDSVITDEEFSLITSAYNSVMLKLEHNNYNNNVVDGTTPKNSIKYGPDKNHIDFSDNKIPGIHSGISNSDPVK